jgi:hypothetical protein
MMKVDQKLALALNKELNRPKVRLINKRRNTFADSEAGHAGLDGDVAGYEQEQRDQKSDHGLRSNAASQVSHYSITFNVRLPHSTYEDYNVTFQFEH